MNIGMWGKRHRRYLKEHRRAVYNSLLLSGELNQYLAEIDQQAEEMYSQLVDRMATNEDISEELKAEDPMLWTQELNNIKNRASEIIVHNLIKP